MMLHAANPAELAIVQHALVVRLATLSRNGRPSIIPIYFIVQHGHIWIGTVDWTLAVHAVRADPRVSLLFTWEQNPRLRQTVQVIGTATIRTDPASLRRYNVGVAMKYILTPGGLWSYLTHVHLWRRLHQYHLQSDQKGDACIIDVTPKQVAVLEADNL